MSILGRKPVEVTAAGVGDMIAPVEGPRDGMKVDGRSMRATGRTVQFANKITEASALAFQRAQRHAGMKKNELLESMIRFWVEKKEDVPEEERRQGRTQPVTVYGDDRLMPYLEILADKRKLSIHAVVEELVAVRIEQLQKAGQLPELKTRLRKSG